MPRDYHNERRDDNNRRPRVGHNPHPMLQYFLPESYGVSREVMTNWIRFHLGRRAHSRFGDYNGCIGHIYTANRELTQAEIEDLQQWTRLYNADPDEYARQAGVVYRDTDASIDYQTQAPPNATMEPRGPRQDVVQPLYAPRNRGDDTYTDSRAPYHHRPTGNSRPDTSGYGVGGTRQDSGYLTGEATLRRDTFDRVHDDSSRGAYQSSGTAGYSTRGNPVPRHSSSSTYDYNGAYNSPPFNSNTDQYQPQYYDRSTGSSTSTQFPGQAHYDMTVSSGRTSSAPGHYTQYGTPVASTDDFLNSMMEGIQNKTSVGPGGGSNTASNSLKVVSSTFSNSTANTGRGGKVKVKEEPGTAEDNTGNFFNSSDRRDTQISSTNLGKGVS